MNNNTLVATLRGHTSCVMSLSFCVNNEIQMFVSGSRDYTIKLWDLPSNTCMHTLTGLKSTIFALAVFEREDKTILISGSEDKTIKLWDVDSPHTTTKTLEGYDEGVRALAVYNNCKW